MIFPMDKANHSLQDVGWEVGVVEEVNSRAKA